MRFLLAAVLCLYKSGTDGRKEDVTDMQVACSGRVCTGGKELHCWDPRHLVQPAIIENYFNLTGGHSRYIKALKSDESAAHPRLLTGMSLQQFSTSSNSRSKTQ